ncbi:elongation factor P--(R)-beta-lysine ligase [Neiella marina]|uniref:Elongation factor P--(R)-beta-lysine ligase n=1 Tax=Neiella holothuriorum TaxID=2870530 RepID=A0ABS7EJP5_9GAMM|nr:elongation factor P--(R)-beta-lysine ligase [Neiella holothuriorum]MBW8192556.1 elongation factor P--(R)-beta-lysine ligase [Neiella holothuriorum]
MNHSKTLGCWQPTMTRAMLIARAQLLASIRRFFADRDVLEVETPVMSQAAVCDIHLQNFVTQFDSPQQAQQQALYLTTSPEFHMKRLLCAGSGPIYQICKSFRNEEQGRFHNPEFTMLEWYRPDFDHHALMTEMAELMTLVIGADECDRMTYQQAFLTHLNVDPLIASLTELQQVAPASCADLAHHETDRDTLLQLLFSMAIEPRIGQQRPVFVYGFPASQAALAELNHNDPRTADRFELYFRGIELANGFRELQDASEQRARFAADNHYRQQHGLPQAPVDELFLQALEAGLPACSGVALGIDRLLMLQQDAAAISDVIAFPVDRA